MTVTLTGNFFANARGLTISDGGGIAWTFNKNTNTLTATGSSGAVLSSAGLTSTDLLVSGSPLTANGSITANLVVQAGVTPASYTYASLTVNNKGVITAVSSGTQPVTSVSSSNLTVGGTAAVPTINLSSTQVTNIGLGGTALQSISIATGTGLTGGPVGAAGATVALNASSIANLALAATAVQPAGLPVGANPAASVGLAAVNGSAGTWMRSDGAPALSVGIVPTWTGGHIFNAAATVSFAGTTTSVGITGLSGASALVALGTDIAVITVQSAAAANRAAITFRQSTTPLFRIGVDGGNSLLTDSTNGDACLAATTVRIGAFGSTTTLKVTGGTAALSGALGVNGATPPAQVTGFGTPVGAAVVASYNSGSSTTLQDKQTIAQILTVLKAAGIIGN